MQFEILHSTPENAKQKTPSVMKKTPSVFPIRVSRKNAMRIATPQLNYPQSLRRKETSSSATEPFAFTPVRMIEGLKLVSADPLFTHVFTGDNLKTCEHCSSRNTRIKTIEWGHEIDPLNPPKRIIYPRVSNKHWVCNIPGLRWLTRTGSYDTPRGWCYIKLEVSCICNKAVNGDCPNVGFKEVTERTGFRKLSLIRWPLILLQCLLWPKSYVLKRATKPAK